MIASTKQWSPQDKLIEEVASIGEQSILVHLELVSLEKKAKDFHERANVLKLREHLKGQVRNFPGIVKKFPKLEVYKS